MRGEGGEYVPHITLTTGLSEAETEALVQAASALDIDFTVEEVALWHESFREGSEEPYWYLFRSIHLDG